jgi:hypothetical protein
VSTPGEELASQHASRSANERFQLMLANRQVGSRLVPFLCECVDDGCLGRVEMSLADYTAAHVDRAQYVVLRGHALMAAEDLVEPRGPFDIVRKS